MRYLLSYSIVRNKRRPYVNDFLIFFPCPAALLKALRLSNFGIFPRVYRYFQVWWVFYNTNLHILFMPYVYWRLYVYSFWQVFQALWLFHALRLFRTLEYKHFESDWANKKENMSNIQIPSTDLVSSKGTIWLILYSQKKSWRKKWLKKLPPRGIEPRSPGWRAKVLTTRPGGQ